MSLDSNSMKTPAYPSGHSLQSRLVAMYYAEKYPEHKTALMMAADECGEGRIYAGWHYPSDHYAAVKLAKQIYPNIQISMNESVIDIPRRTYAPNVFDDEETSDPKIIASVKAQIDKQIKEFEKEYPVIKTTLIGSILFYSRLSDLSDEVRGFLTFVKSFKNDTSRSFFNGILDYYNETFLDGTKEDDEIISEIEAITL